MTHLRKIMLEELEGRNYIPFGPNVRPAVPPKPFEIGWTRCVLASECIECFCFTELELQRRMCWHASITSARRSFRLHR